MDKERMRYAYKGILFNFERKGNPVICYTMVETWDNHKWNKPVTEGEILDDSIYISYPK